jgi:hypothetical protein
VLLVNIHPDPANGEDWFSADELPLDAIRNIEQKLELAWSFWERVWEFNAELPRMLREVALLESGTVATEAEAKLGARKLTYGLLRRGRVVKVVNDDDQDANDGLPEQWEGSLPLPEVPATEPSTT